MEMRYGSYPLASTASWYAQNNEQQGTATTDLSSRDKCVYATDVMFNTESYTMRKAYTAASIITHAQSEAIKQAHIRTSNLLCNNYDKLGPSNANLTPAKPITNNYSRTETQKSNNWELQLDQHYTTPLTQQEALNKHKAESEHLPQQARKER
ncbi:hypothetical protein F511_27753 [Dorcoceras hygrometricum]|uniref:Uncharacterized protein n=1 Tax=Dorcoceras hygrometricum TaxID=472368 RepID=A0A2Z7BHK0_9LAMI|nr:hypothetical protein F511_27753 [Dorcoceras hygrometricum]